MDDGSQREEEMDAGTGDGGSERLKSCLTNISLAAWLEGAPKETPSPGMELGPLRVRFCYASIRDLGFLAEIVQYVDKGHSSELTNN
jgi:hypothetical protein